MNNKRRNKIQNIIDHLEDVIADEQDAYDNMPEGIQGSDKGEVMEEGLGNLNEAKDLLENSIG